MTKTKENEYEKAYFYKRVIAYIIDVLIVSIVATIIALPFRTEAIKKVDNQVIEVTQKALQGKIKTDVYQSQMNELMYQKAKLDGIANITSYKEYIRLISMLAKSCKKSGLRLYVFNKYS